MSLEIYKVLHIIGLVLLAMSTGGSACTPKDAKPTKMVPILHGVGLLVLDGAGFRTEQRGNAVTKATLPSIFRTMDDAGFAVLEAAGEAVGLEAGQVGNSEAGHLTIGAGEIEPSLARKLALVYDDGSWQRDPAWQKIQAHGVLHITGLLSDAGVHALVRTMKHAAAIAAAHGIKEILVHPALDGMDSRAGTAPALLADLRQALDAIPGARLGVAEDPEER